MGINRLSQMAFCIWMQWGDSGHTMWFIKSFQIELYAMYFYIKLLIYKFMFLSLLRCWLLQRLLIQFSWCSENWRLIFFNRLLISVWGNTSYWESFQTFICFLSFQSVISDLSQSISENSFTFVSPVLISLKSFTTVELKAIKWLTAPQVNRPWAYRRFHFLLIK